MSLSTSRWIYTKHWIIHHLSTVNNLSAICLFNYTNSLDLKIARHHITGRLFNKWNATKGRLCGDSERKVLVTCKNGSYWSNLQYMLTSNFAADHEYISIPLSLTWHSLDRVTIEIPTVMPTDVFKVKIPEAGWARSLARLNKISIRGAQTINRNQYR